MKHLPDSCDDCGAFSPRLSRRSFLGAAALAAGAGLTSPLHRLGAAETTKATGKADALVLEWFKSLDETQRKAVVFPYDHPDRLRVENNWHIVEQSVGKLFTPDQQAMVRDIFTHLHSEEYGDKVWEQFRNDNREGGLKTKEETFGTASCAVFGTPGEGAFDFVLTGRHCTRRCDGDSKSGTAFGGPIFYGHAAGSFTEKPDHPGNVYWFQAQQANALFQALDGKQRDKALLDVKAPGERGSDTVKLRQKKDGIEGIAVGDLSSDQKEFVGKVLSDLLLPFRKEDRDEAMRLVTPQLDHLHFAYYKQHDVGSDGVWDVWKVEGPAMIWYFRGQPHVHTWVHIKEMA